MDQALRSDEDAKRGENKNGIFFERGRVPAAKIKFSSENGKPFFTMALASGFGFATAEVNLLQLFKEDHDSQVAYIVYDALMFRFCINERKESMTGRQRVTVNVLLDLPFL